MRLIVMALGVGVLALSPAGAARIRPLGHANPGGGYTGDVFVHRGFAYLSSWHGVNCPAQGVRVYDLSKPAHPRRVSTFADGSSDLSVRGTWTEKTIVQHAATASFRGELAAVSFQHCPGTNSYRGFGLYDVTHPRAPRHPPTRPPALPRSDGRCAGRPPFDRRHAERQGADRDPRDQRRPPVLLGH